MKVEDVGYVQVKGNWMRFTIVAIHEELGGTLTVANGVSEWTCKQSEFIPEQTYKETISLPKERAEQEPRLRAVIDAFNAGHKTSIKIAEHLKIHHLAARGKMLAAHRLKFIELPIGADGFPDPNPKNESNPV